MGTPLTARSVECRWGRQKNAVLDAYLASLHTGLQCRQLYESRTVKNKATTDGGERRAHRGVRHCSHKTTTKCLWWARRYTPDRRSNPLPRHIPLVITPVFCCRRTSYRTEPGGYFCWKLTLARTPDPIRPTRQGPDPNRPTNGRKQGGYDLGVFVRGGWSDTAGDNRRQQNRS